LTTSSLHLIVGGLHLLPAEDDEIKRITNALRDRWQVAWIAPGHCTGEPGFEILKRAFGARYLYAGLGTTLSLDSNPTAAVAEQWATVEFDEVDRATYHELARLSSDVSEHTAFASP
jgi:7,8-dihydropterin-6-yl-methyl-4-(beta-D-ribofuranosyl)aminobenzene 5'-phosphate synthase